MSTVTTAGVLELRHASNGRIQKGNDAGMIGMMEDKGVVRMTLVAISGGTSGSREWVSRQVGRRSGCGKWKVYRSANAEVVL